MQNGNRGGRVSTNYTDVREAVPVASIKPFEDEEVYVANEAFSAVQVGLSLQVFATRT